MLTAAADTRRRCPSVRRAAARGRLVRRAARARPTSTCSSACCACGHVVVARGLRARCSRAVPGVERAAHHSRPRRTPMAFDARCRNAAWGSEGVHDGRNCSSTCVDRLRNRFFGKYRGIVTDVDASTMRDQGHGARGARRPDRPAGACRACRTPARAWASASCPSRAPACGSSSRAATSRYPIWTGCYWRPGRGARPTPRPPCKVIVTPGAQTRVRRRRRRDRRIRTPTANTVTLDRRASRPSAAVQAVAISDVERVRSTTAPWR